MENNATSYWGEVVEENPGADDINFDELFQPKAAECDELKLHQVTSKETSSKESSNVASIQPPLDSHGQNLLLHSIELKHHIKKMMLMKMAAQHQQAGGNKNDNLPQLPAAPPPPKKYCEKNGIIYVRPHRRGFLSNPSEIDTKSAYITGHGSSAIELDSDSLRCLTYKAIAAICCHCGYESAHDITLDVLSDVLADFLKRFTKLLRIAIDAEASQRESRFPNALEYVLQETGMGGLNAIWQYWSTNVLDYTLKLQQEDQRLMADYEKLT